jgi:hypothetical protein
MQAAFPRTSSKAFRRDAEVPGQSKDRLMLDDKVTIAIVTTIGAALPPTLVALAGFWRVTANQRNARTQSRIESAEVKNDLHAQAASVKSELHVKAEEVKQEVQVVTDAQTNTISQMVDVSEKDADLRGLNALLAAIDPRVIADARRKIAEQKKRDG